MSRKKRMSSKSGFYHVVIRGVNKTIIFKNEKDRNRFYETMIDKSFEEEIEIYAYCYMNNHVHLLLSTEERDNLSAFMKRLSISYANYFNKKYERVGHLFQNRFWSVPIEGESYFLSALRYIHNNPEKAGICSRDDYKWSSYLSYLGRGDYINLQVAMDIFGNEKNFISFHNAGDDFTHLEVDMNRRIPDSEAVEIICGIAEVETLNKICDMSKEMQCEIVKESKRNGLAARQIARITGLEKSFVQRVKK